MGITFKEKSLWIQLVTISVVFASYFLSLDYTNTQSLPENITSHFIGLIIALIVLNIIAHAFAAAFNKPEQEDERDKLITLKASKVHSFILTMGVVAGIFTCLLTENLFLTVNILIQFLVFSEVAEKAVQLFYYRKGI